MSTHQQVRDIVAPHDHDVLSGRGNFVNYHTGNEHFRGLVRKHKVAYVACPKPQKGKFSRMIVDEVRNRTPPGRFLKQDAKTKLWYDIGEKKALDKTRQALREGAPDIMKELTGDAEDSSADEAATSPALPQQQALSCVTTCATVVGPERGTTSAQVQSNLGNFVAPQVDHVVMPRYDSFQNGQQEMQQLLMQSMLPNGQPTQIAYQQHHQRQQQQQQHRHHQQQQVSHNSEGNNVSMSQYPAPMIPGHPLPPPHLATPREVSQHDLPHAGSTHLYQHAAQRIQRPLNGLNLQGVPIANMHGTNYSDIDALQTKISNLSQQMSGFEIPEPRPFEPTFFKASEQSPSSPPENVGPLPRRKQALKVIKREHKREGSEGSLVVENIFGSKSNDSSEKSKVYGYGSSAHLSVMSLSIGDMGAAATDLDPADADELTPLFNTSMRLNGTPSGTRVKRSGSGDGTFGENMDMSTATLGDRMSDFGETSITRMSESQANMSFSNVFDDTV